MLGAADLDVHTWDADPAELAADLDFPGSERARTTLPLAAGRLRGTGPGPRLLLVGHTDVVPPGDPASVDASIRSARRCATGSSTAAARAT